MKYFVAILLVLMTVSCGENESELNQSRSGPGFMYKPRIIQKLENTSYIKNVTTDDECTGPERITFGSTTYESFPITITDSNPAGPQLVIAPLRITAKYWPMDIRSSSGKKLCKVHAVVSSPFIFSENQLKFNFTSKQKVFDGNCESNKFRDFKKPSTSAGWARIEDTYYQFTQNKNQLTFQKTYTKFKNSGYDQETSTCEYTQLIDLNYLSP